MIFQTISYVFKTELTHPLTMWVSKLSSQQDEKHCAGAGVRLGGVDCFQFLR
jgi:hypothetical protein